MLPATLPALLGQEYPGALRPSSWSIAAVPTAPGGGRADRPPVGRPLRVIPGTAAPPGWAGKVRAMAEESAPPHPGGRARRPRASRPRARRLRAVHRRRYRLGGAHAAPPGGRGRGDDRDLVSQMALLRTATGWERVVVPAFVYFLAQALSVPAGQRARLADGRGGRRLHAGAPRRAGEMRRPWRRSAACHRRRGHGPHDQAAARSLLARAVPPGGQRPPVPGLGQLVADGGQVRLHPAELLPGAAGGDHLGLLFLYVLPPAGAVTGIAVLLVGGTGPASAARRRWRLELGVGGWALMSLSYLPMLRLYRLSPLRAPGLPLWVCCSPA